MPIFSDLNTGFSLNAAPLVLTDMMAVQNKVFNVFNCNLGTRFMQPEFGTRLYEFIHEPCDEITAHKILYDLFDALKRWVPEVKVILENSWVIPREGGDGYYVKISYYVPLLQQQGALSFSSTRE